MAYTPENNPYIPGDPYSYDLKWLVTKIKAVVSDLQTAVTDIEAAADLAGRALTTATQAGNTADIANSVAGQAYELAQDAMEAASQAGGAVEIIDIVYNWLDTNTAQMNTEYTWQELCEKVKAGKVAFRCFAADDLPQPIYFAAPVYGALMVAYGSSPDNFINARLQIDFIHFTVSGNAWDEGTYVFADKIWFMNNLSAGTAYRRIIDTIPVPV